jgi:hypothetical protein
MNSQNPSELARQGDPNAIALLINQRLKPKGVTAKVNRKDSCLEVSLHFDGKQPVPKESLLKFIESGIRKLEIPGIKTIDISGFKIEEEKPIWSQRIYILSEERLKDNSVESFSVLQETDSQDALLNAQDKNQKESKKGRDLLDYIILLFSLFFGLFNGVNLSGIFGEGASPALRVALGVFGICLPSIIILVIKQHRQWKKIRLAIISVFMVAVSISFIRLNQSVQERQISQDPEVEETIQEQQISQAPELEETILISQRAAQLRMGMTYREVIDLFGRMPDTVVNDQIRQELGEPVQGNNLVSFHWENDNPNCASVVVQFNPSNMTVTGWDEGRLCTGPSIFNEPFGKSCNETTLCQN